MAISRQTQDLLAKGDFEAVEDDWLTHLEEDPHDLDYFVGVARALVGHGQPGRAGNLLEMLATELGGRQSHRIRLGLLRRAGEIFNSTPEALHASILSTLSALYGGGPSFQGLAETVGLLRATHDIPKTWEKVERLESLVAFELGEIVYMEGKGAGRVVEVNLQLQTFRVEIPGLPKMAVGFRAAPKLLKRLNGDHFLHRKLTGREELAAIAKEDPPELLRILLCSYDGPLTATEIKRDLAGLVPESAWTSWWTAARKHSQVVVSGAGSRQTYSWAASNEHALASVWKAFERADPRKKIDLYRREGGRDEELRERMEEALGAVASRAVASDPSLALEMWLALDKDGRAPDGEPWSAAALLATRPDPRHLIIGVEDRALRERAYQLLRALREDWPRHFAAALLKEDDARTLELLTSTLAEEDPSAFGRFFDTVLAQPAKSPAAFVWLAEQAADHSEIRARSPLRLFQQTLGALSLNELAPYRASRLMALFDSGSTVPRLLAHLSEDEAARAWEAVDRAGYLETYRRDDLKRALELRFPLLRPVEEVLPLYGLPATLEARRAELHQILTKEIPANRKAIEEARAMGDLRENFEYKSARQRHEYLTSRAAELKGQLDRARPLDLATTDPSEVRIGTTLELAGDGETRTLSILGPWESDPEAGIVSYESELGQGLLGKKVGDLAEVGGSVLEIREIRVFGG